MEPTQDLKNNLTIGDPHLNYDSMIKPVEETKGKHFSDRENEQNNQSHDTRIKDPLDLRNHSLSSQKQNDS